MDHLHITATSSAADSSSCAPTTKRADVVCVAGCLPASALAAFDDPTAGPDGLARVWDPGLSRTVACRSAVTFLDGDAGELRYRGFDVADLAAKLKFEQVAWLVVFGQLPSASELELFREEIAAYAVVPKALRESLLACMTPRTHPMAALQAAFALLSGFDRDDRTPGDPNGFQSRLGLMLGVLPQIAGDIHRRHAGLDPIDVGPEASFAERLLHASLGTVPSPKAVRALDVLLVCHADHEQNCSTTALRTAASAHADVYVALAAAAGALAGPLHGGANEEVIRQLRVLAETGESGAELVAKAESGELRLMGFGHRVYKNYDPRARVIRVAAGELFDATSVHPLLALALDVEQAALASDYFRERKLYPNVDFFSGLVYEVLGFDPSFFTVLFALGRTPGWLAHGTEQLADSDSRIIRPRQIYNGLAPRTLD